MPTQKSLKQHLAFLNLYKHAKNQFIPSIDPREYSQFESHVTGLAKPISTMPTYKIFNQLLIFVILHQHA